MIVDQTSEVFTEVTNLEKLSQVLKAKGFKVVDVEIRQIPGNKVEVTNIEQARSLFKLIDTLEGLDDVQSVTSNLEIADNLMVLSMT
jgi:transcriptional/translational regulatory protein YebC/TACO1